LHDVKETRIAGGAENCWRFWSKSCYYNKINDMLNL
jgi:hypothetical protein